MKYALTRQQPDSHRASANQLALSQSRRQKQSPSSFLSPVQRMESLEEDESLQGKFDLSQRMPMEEEESLQGKFSPGPFQPPIQQQANHTGMPDPVKGNMEQAFQTDFSDVKIHANSAQAPQVGALAYTQGSNIHFAPGQFRPESSSGRELLGHELTHVVQQREGRVSATTEVAGMPVNDQAHLEHEADQMGRKVSH